MKASSVPISSPIRATEKLTPPPPPLMIFLSCNLINKGKNRSRPIPLFGKRNGARLIRETSQEPSSPKVTCIGQVRVRRSPVAAAYPDRATSKRRRWWWLKKPLFGYKFSCGFRRYRAFRRFLCRWALFCRAGYGKKEEIAGEDPFMDESNVNSQKNGDFEAENVPRNALLLTRCRSVTRGSSSLGGRLRSLESKIPLRSGERGVYINENEPKSEQIFQESRDPSSEMCRSQKLVLKVANN